MKHVSESAALFPSVPLHGVSNPLYSICFQRHFLPAAALLSSACLGVRVEEKRFPLSFSSNKTKFLLLLASPEVMAT